MKKTVVLLATILALGLSAQAQKANIEFPEYKFTTIKENPITPVKNHHRI